MRITGPTGAGKSRLAGGGLLFLDEVGELGADEQAMLLRAVEDRRFTPLGADRESQSDFQLICGTNRDLAAAVRDGPSRARSARARTMPTGCAST
jgi:transcriptional regulatory protein RtcR